MMLLLLLLLLLLGLGPELQGGYGQGAVADCHLGRVSRSFHGRGLNPSPTLRSHLPNKRQYHTK